MKQFLQRNGVFITLSLILIIALGLALLCIPKGNLHLLLCDRHTHARDIFYRYYTHVAEWFPYIVCLALIFFSRLGEGLCASTAMLGSTLTTQLFKHIIRAPRPVTWFSTNMPEVQLPLVEGVKMNRWLSFPSGHTTAFFALAFILSIVAGNYLINKNCQSGNQNGPSRNKIYLAQVFLIQVVLFIMAATGGYSRIYLCQHFALDVLAGIVVGVLISLISYVVFYQYKDRNWYNYRILSKK